MEKRTGIRGHRPVASLLALLLLVASALAVAPAAVAQVAPMVEGPTVTADPSSPTGYTVTFVYRNPDATQVRLAGDLTLLDVDTGRATRYEPEEWEPGRYHAGGTEFLRDMTKDENGYWSVSVPLHAGGLSYWYRVWDPTQGWENKRIWDPASPHPRPPGDTSFRVRNNDVLDTVYVPYAEEQDDPILEARATYELPAADPARRGTVQYVPYTTILGDDGHHLGVYLPAGYDPDRAEPYKVVYLAHGIFGDETDFMVPVNVPNILDNMTARGEIEPTVVVTMGNHFTGTGLNFASYDRLNAANNLVEVILPFVEERFNVSSEREGRAYGGFSYGGSTGGFVIANHPTAFGSYGFFSGNPTLTDANYDALAAAVGTGDLTVFLGNGIFEGGPDAHNAIAESFRSRGFTAGTAQVPGAHDGMTAGQLFTIFARDYLWEQDEPVGEVDVSVETDTRCVVGRAVQVLRVTNGSDAPAEVTLSTAYGARTITVGPERSTTVTLSTRLESVPASEVTATATADGYDPTTLTVPYAAFDCALEQGIQGVVPITEILAYGQKVTAVAVEYSADVDPRGLDLATFTVSDSLYNFRFNPVADLTDPTKRADRTITAIYTNDAPSLEADQQSDRGRYVIIELDPMDPGGSTVIAWQGGVRVNPDLQTRVVQNEAVHVAPENGDGQGPVLARASAVAHAPTQPAVNLLYDDFVYERFTTSTGTEVPYAYWLPEDYDATKQYPVVVILPGHGQGYIESADGTNNEGVQVASDIPAVAWLQEEWTESEEDVIVLAVQNRRTGTGADQAGAMVEVVNGFADEFSVDPDRIYGSTVSYGSVLAWDALTNHPGLFDAMLVTGGFGASQAQADAIAASRTPVWVTHGTGDHLLNVVTTGQASFNRIWNAYMAMGLTPAQATALVKYTEYPLAAFYEPDQHLAAAPTYEDASILRWLLDQ
ncbi:alpha/beta hydrolase-fold protein [Georgenia faecalis]|uniref:Alpha/beta hydrolase-fold protein n=1 Tax=Georgenia faecalis TaxID=2483799 RepID=A0ABV9DE22_9MICO|nr:alpha/beta hydrolase-fold protein [Georgenia faecalis]